MRKIMAGGGFLGEKQQSISFFGKIFSRMPDFAKVFLTSHDK